MKTRQLKARVRQPKSIQLALSALLAAFISVPAVAQERTYTFDADFDEGSLVNINHNAPNNDQLQLDSQATPFNFIWIAMSGRGTVVKINTNTGAILGEYRTTPSNQGLGNPSRTTVDNDGSVWVANRNDVSNGYGTVLHIGLLENGQCEDRDNSGTIETSMGLSDIRPWADNSGTRGVATADDECIVHYTQVNSRGTRHVSVDENNDVWVSGSSLQNFDLIKGGRYDVISSGDIIRVEPSVGFGGYGGLIDGDGVIWSARNLLRWDTVNHLVGANGDPVGPSIGPPTGSASWSGQLEDSYGLCIDSQGNVWNTQLSGNLIRKYAPDGTFLGSYPHGNNWAQGCVVDGNDHVWVAHSLVSNGQTTVGHLLNDGTYIGNVSLDGGVGPTGVAVDAQGKIWSANYQTSTASRIDPMAGPVGADAVTRVGAVDLTVDLGANGSPYNYSDMTGSTLIAPPNSGTWSVDYDSSTPGVEWGFITWHSDEPNDSLISVEVASSTDGITFSPSEPVMQGVDLTVPDGQFLRVTVRFTRASTGDSPILYDLTISANHPPKCKNAFADPAEIWPPNHKFVPVRIRGIRDPDRDRLTISIDSIFQDEPLDTFGDGHFEPDGKGIGRKYAKVRAERSGSKKVPGDGRVYHIGFTASDGRGGECSGKVTVCVPHDQRPGHACIDQGPLYKSTARRP